MDEGEVSRFLGDEATRRRTVALLLATAEHDRWLKKRSRALVLVALSGLPCWLLLAWPSLADRSVRAGALAVWAVLAALLAITMGGERWSARRLTRARCRARDAYLERR